MQITNELIESLLYEEEGTTLDFKREQYPFEGAGKEQKSELLKDILAFTNAFRRSDAFILIGVEEVKGGKSEIVGVATQLDGAKLQQFVNSTTQRPVTFAYREVEHDGLPIGIIHIQVQRRPVYTKADCGIVKKETVYLRRGSSTDIAKPDEVAQMGADQAAPHGAEPSFTLALIERKTGKSLSEKIELRSLWLEFPKEKDIPDYEEERDMFMSHIGTNRDYYRDLAKFNQTINFFQPVTLAIQNTSGVTAHDVRLVFELDDPKSQKALGQP